MKIQLAAGVLAGFMSVDYDGESGLMHAGEQWVARNFKIHSHSHEHWELYLQSSGESIWISGGQTVRVQAGALYIAPPTVTHAMDKEQEAKHHFLFASINVEAVLARLTGELPRWPADRVIHIVDASSVSAPFRLLIREASLDQPYRAAGVRAAMDALVIETSRLIANQSNEARQTVSFEHPSVSYARQLMDYHMSRDWRIADLAEIVGISPQHLADTFVRDVGMTPHRYLVEQRLIAAEVYLRESELSITEIAVELGFSSSQYFATVYRRYRGVSPRDLRSKP